MKKVVSALLIMLMLCNLLPFSAVAAGNGSISMGSASGAQGDSVTLNVNLTNNPGLVTMTIKVSYDTSVLQLTKVSDPQLLVGAQLNPRYNSPYTISWVDGTTTVNNTKTGEIAAFTFKILDTAKVGDSTVTLQFVDSYDTNYQENSFSASSGKVSVTCKSHHFGSYTKVNDNQHSRTCSACGYVETVNHSWDGGTVTKQATCKESGTKEYTCTACGAKKAETVAKTNSHSWGGYTVTKQPTCTAAGVQTRTCSVCGKTESQTVNATGHKFGAWAQSKAPTCTEGGTQERKCSVCGATESRNTKALGHDFENPTIVKEATISSTGLKEGKCKRCGETTSEVIPCTARDEATGTSFEAAEGAFSAGTELTVEKIPSDNPTYDSAKNVLQDIGKDFTLYDIAATFNGAAAQPNGEVTASFTIPDGYGTDVAVYFIAADGTAEKLESTVSEDGKTVSAKLMQLGSYAVCKLGDADAAAAGDANTDVSDPATDGNGGSHTTVYILLAIVAVLVIGGAVAAIVIVKKKKSR